MKRISLLPLLCVAACSAFGASNDDARAPDGGDASASDAAGDAPVDAAASPDADADAGAIGFAPCINNDAGKCERYSFVTSATYAGAAITGYAGADQKCTLAAAASSVAEIRARRFRAWLSTASTNAADRFPHDGKILRPDGEVLADTWSDFLSGPYGLAVPPDVDEKNVIVTGFAWTGTKSDGTLLAGDKTCLDWTGNPGIQARAGSVGATNGSWTDYIDQPCTALLHLYCLEW